MSLLFLLLFLLFFLIGTFLAIWAFLIEPNRLVINHYNLRLKKWSKQHHGLKIVAVSDFHAGERFITERKIRRVAQKINEQKPDLIVLLGDYVTYPKFHSSKLKMPMPVIAESLKNLQARYGVYAVLGNHDYSFGSKSVRDELEKNGYRVLEHEADCLEINDEKLLILGLKYYRELENKKELVTELKRMLIENHQTESVLLLEHNPDLLPDISEELSITSRISLFLAGHTHGGQCRFPFVGAPVVSKVYGQKYAAGFVRDLGIDLFVTTGIGTSKIPVRFMVPPEISVLTIFSENN